MNVSYIYAKKCSCSITCLVAFKKLSNLSSQLGPKSWSTVRTLIYLCWQSFLQLRVRFLLWHFALLCKWICKSQVLVTRCPRGREKMGIHVLKDFVWGKVALVGIGSIFHLFRSCNMFHDIFIAQAQGFRFFLHNCFRCCTFQLSWCPLQRRWTL